MYIYMYIYMCVYTFIELYIYIYISQKEGSIINVRLIVQRTSHLMSLAHVEQQHEREKLLKQVAVELDVVLGVSRQVAGLKGDVELGTQLVVSRQIAHEKAVKV